MFIVVILLDKNNNIIVKDKIIINKVFVGCQVIIVVYIQLFWCYDNFELKTVFFAEIYYSKEKIDIWKIKISKK